MLTYFNVLFCLIGYKFSHFFFVDGIRTAGYTHYTCRLTALSGSREKERDLTQSYDKSPHTDRKIHKAT